MPLTAPNTTAFSPLHTDYRPLLKRYKQLRQASRQVHERLQTYSSKRVLKGSAQSLRMWSRGTLVGDEDSLCVLMEYCLYEYRHSRKDKSIVERFVSTAFDREVSDLNEDQAAIRRYMATARYALLQVRQVVPGVGVWADGLLRDEDALFLTDVGFGQTAVPELVIATRIIHADGFWMTTGAPLFVDVDTLENIFAHLKQRYGHHLERLGDLDRMQWTDMATRIIRICLASRSW